MGFISELFGGIDTQLQVCLRVNKLTVSTVIDSIGLQEGGVLGEWEGFILTRESIGDSEHVLETTLTEKICSLRIKGEGSIIWREEGIIRTTGEGGRKDLG